MAATDSVDVQANPFVRMVCKSDPTPLRQSVVSERTEFRSHESLKSFGCEVSHATAALVSEAWQRQRALRFSLPADLGRQHSILAATSR